MEKGDIRRFNTEKDFKYIKELGQGGTGDTKLFLDPITNMQFAIKKYSPKNVEYIDEYYERFIDEIKILFNISHPNIVRIYNYYLYPQNKAGYLQMEYIDGITIDQYAEFTSDRWWNDIFKDVVDAFEYLESKGILHRDIRPQNIMLDSQENVKIIDFGFGKQLTVDETAGKSIVLNWPVSEFPLEIKDRTYTHQTEVYFIGKLFSSLIKEDLGEEMNGFKYKYIIDKMVKVDPKQRYKCFNEISKNISAGILGGLDFSEDEKKVYRLFINQLYLHINHFNDSLVPEYDTKVILSKLENLIEANSLDEFISNNAQLISCFVNMGYSYKTKSDIKLGIVADFYMIFSRLSNMKKKVVLDNIYNRLSKIDVQIDYNSDDLPF